MSYYIQRVSTTATFPLKTTNVRNVPYLRGYQSQFKVHNDSLTQVHSVQSSLTVNLHTYWQAELNWYEGIVYASMPQWVAEHEIGILQL